MKQKHASDLQGSKYLCQLLKLERELTARLEEPKICLLVV